MSACPTCGICPCPAAFGYHRRMAECPADDASEASTPRPSEADELAFAVCPDLEHATHDGHDCCEQVTQRLSDWLIARDAARDAEHEREVAEAEVRGQMRHITAEMVRGDQSLGEQEDLIADLRARLSHVEAERDAAHEAGYRIGYGEGKKEAETRDLNYDDRGDA